MSSAPQGTDCDGFPGDPQPKYPDVEVQLSGEDGNAYAIMGRVAEALKDAGYGDEVPEYQRKSMAGDYDNLLRTAMEYVNVS